MPHSGVRLSAGRESMNREAQILCLQAGADSIFYGDVLLTTGNPDVEADRQLLADAGVTPRGRNSHETPISRPRLYKLNQIGGERWG